MFHEIIFHLLNIYRKDEAQTLRALRRRLISRLVNPELLNGGANINYWIRLCRSTGLLDDGVWPTPTLLAEYWWGYSLFDQVDLLVNGWVGSVSSGYRRKLRLVLLQRLRRAEALKGSQVQEAEGLAPLGLFRGGQITEFGRLFLVEKKVPAEPIRTQNWQLQPGWFLVPYPPDWGLLWDLETYLDPLGPGKYSLAPGDLQRAAQRGALKGNFHAHHARSLAAILELGLGQPVPAEISTSLAAQPDLRLLPGPVLETSDPETLKQLRKSKRLRPYLDQVLSPRHIHLSPWQAARLLAILRRMGWEVAQPAQAGLYSDRVQGGKTAKASQDLNRLSTAERLYCLSLALFAEGFHSPYAPPPGLLRKLGAGLAPALSAAADDHASALLAVLYPRPEWTPEVTPPALPEPELLDFLQNVIDREESIDILYKASARHTPEYRHISPLMLEHRNERWYISAYCHNRRGQRLFRLDRLKIIDVFDVTTMAKK